MSKFRVNQALDEYRLIDFETDAVPLGNGTPTKLYRACLIRGVSIISTAIRPCLTFLTDFGTTDTYVGQMKGVALSIHPDLHIVDLTHEIPPQQIERAACVWSDAIDSFSPASTHVAVVDPGVGSQRRLIAAEIGHYRVVCPDNGLVSFLLQREPLRRAVVLENRRYWRSEISNTFHGRDILTPVAAAWSQGIDLSEFGPPVPTPLVTLKTHKPVRGRTSITGQIIHIDRFGNLITSIEADSLPPERQSLRFEIGSFQVQGLSTCYADVSEGDPLALIGSSGRVEISIRNGNAAEELNANCGRPIIVRWETTTS